MSTAGEGPTFDGQLRRNMTFTAPCIVIYSYNKSQQDDLFLKFILYNTEFYLQHVLQFNDNIIYCIYIYIYTLLKNPRHAFFRRGSKAVGPMS